MKKITMLFLSLFCFESVLAETVYRQNGLGQVEATDSYGNTIIYRRNGLGQIESDSYGNTTSHRRNGLGKSNYIIPMVIQPPTGKMG